MILTVTPNPALDHTLTVDEPLEPERVTRTDAARYDPGGKGINVSKYLDALGTETLATGFLGESFGAFLERRLRDADLATDFVEIDGVTRLNTTVLAPNGEFKVNQNGPEVSASAVDAAVDAVVRHDPETVVVAGSLPPGTGPETVDRIADAGAWDTVVDVDGPLLRRLDADYALCKPNREELAVAADAPVDTVEQCLDAAERLRDGRNGRYERVVASLGDDGAILVSDDGAYHASALETSVVDTVGAGDALLSGVLSAFAVGASEPEALKTGIAVAAAVVAVSGTRVPPFADVSERTERVSLSRL
ncbi:1-phosphofructokinase [Haloprofundus salinisoli]|uniref:1-phosphofructokinase n=1 Tax=Haloprofundus salinisoli TaxID=2876193 RepID=UPI001CCCD85F|nr:1-phosphofructokinase [Haloprofundus salinisoli]